MGIKRLLIIMMLAPSLAFAQGGGGTPATKVQEVDGTPVGRPRTMKYDNGSLTDNADGSFTHSISGYADDRYLKLDQSTPQHVTGDFPRFDKGIGIVGNYSLYWRNLADDDTVAYISYSGDLQMRNVSGVVYLQGDLIDLVSTPLTTLDTITGEQITSTDDITAADDITLNGLLTNNMAAGDSTGVLIDGATADCTATGTTYGVQIDRDINSASGTHMGQKIDLDFATTSGIGNLGYGYWADVSRDAGASYSGTVGIGKMAGLIGTVGSTAISYENTGAVNRTIVNDGVTGTVTASGTMTQSSTGTITNYARGGVFSASNSVVGDVTALTYGVSAIASGSTAGTSTAYGIYAKASGADTNYAGYFDGAVNVGDDTNYTEIKSDGEINLHGTARVYKTEWVNPQGLKAPGIRPATAVEWGIAGGWEFSDGTDDTIAATVRLPQDLDRTVAVEFKIGFASDTNTGDVVWQLEYLFVSPNEDTTAAAQETLTTTTTISATVDGLTIATITGIDLPSATDQLVRMRIKRLGADASDTLSDDCVLLGCGLKYVSDKLGVAL